MNNGNKAMLVISNGTLHIVDEWRYNRSHVSTYPEALAKLFANGFTKFIAEYRERVYYNYTYCFRGVYNGTYTQIHCNSWRSLIDEVNTLQL